MSCKSFISGSLLCLCAVPATADLVTFNTSVRKVTPAEANAGVAGGGSAPLNGDVYQFAVTTDADILSVNQVLISLSGGATLYHNAFGDAANANEGQPALIPVFPALGVDSWINTPGNTVRLGADLPGDGVTTFGDLQNDGPVTNFIFAQLTVPEGTQGSFSGRISIPSTNNPGAIFNQPFSFQFIPEPSAFVMAGVGMAGALAAGRCRRRG
jgi:hypothetical protein